MREWVARGGLLLRFGKGGSRAGSWRWLTYSLVLMLCAAVIAAAPAQSGQPPGVQASLVADTSELTVGDWVTLSLIVSHPEDSTAVVPRLEREWGPFEVQAQTSVQTVSLTDGIRTVAKQFRVTLFAPGSFQTPDLPVSIRGSDGTVTHVSPSPVRLTVKTVLSSPDDELKDLRMPADLPAPFWERTIILVLIIVVALVLLGGTALFFFRRSRRAEEPAGASPDMRTSWDLAIQELDRIARRDLPGIGDMREHYTLLSAALRTYLGATYIRDASVRNADDMSTEEIAAGIQGSALDLGNARLVIELLQEADLVKFANHEPTAARAKEAVVQIRNIVEATRPTVTGASGAAPVAHGAAP